MSPVKTRYFIFLSYKGTSYHGWQLQPNAITVQKVIDEALSTILEEEILTSGAGRTDTGVHASVFCAHFESIASDIDTRKNMVWAIVGTLIEVGSGKMNLDEFRNIILAKDRCRAGKSTPAKALFLSGIEYPDEIFI